jgi:hypothetical protein
MRKRSLLPTITALTVTAACGGTEHDDDQHVTPPAKIELLGSYTSNFGGTEAITETKWGDATIVTFDNEANFAITQQPADDTFNPSKFAKVVWTEPVKGAFFYCTVDFGKDTAAEAQATSNTADASDPTSSGCGGFAWTELYEAIEIEGTWHSNFGGTETVNHRTFGFTAVVEFDNDTNWVIVQNAADAEFDPGKFARIVWTEPANGRFYYCFTVFGQDTADDARSAPDTSDPSNPANAGCGGFAWTRLEPTLEISGTYESSFGGTEEIDSDMWGTAFVREYDNDENVVYLQLPPTDEFNPDKFNKVVFTEPVEGAFYYCWVDFGLETLEEAKASTTGWDDSDPENAGCGGFAWTKLTPE